MWERFSFYGMKGLLIYYLTKYHFFSDDFAYEISGNYAALVYALPVLGGYLADRFIGFKKAVTFGAILLILGHFGMAFEGHQAYVEDGVTIRDELALNVFYFSMALLIMGVGFLKPNISSMVGGLYKENDPRRDSGFTLFYMGINVGALLAAVLCVYLGEKVGWSYGFGAAGIGMIIGLLVFLAGKKHLVSVGNPPDPALLKKKTLPVIGINTETLIYSGSLTLVVVCYMLVQNHSVVGMLLLGSAGIILISLAWVMGVKLDKIPRERMIVILILCLYALVFFAFLEQQFFSLGLFTDRMVNRNIAGFEIEAGQFLSLNSVFIIVLAPVFAWFWIWLNKRKCEPNILVKFALGVLLAALGIAMLPVGLKMAGVHGKVHVVWLVLCYLFISMGELSLSPVGLSSVTKLSVKTMVGFMMGVWFLASAGSEFLAALMSKIASIETTEGINFNQVEAYNAYFSLYEMMIYIGLGFGLLLLLFSPFIKKMMHGIR
jgi:POT family proton-dependent oligopeptide transporter